MNIDSVIETSAVHILLRLSCYKGFVTNIETLERFKIQNMKKCQVLVTYLNTLLYHQTKRPVSKYTDSLAIHSSLSCIDS